MSTDRVSYNYLEDFVTKIRAKGRYLFTLDEVKSAFNFSDQAIKKSLKRLRDKKKIVLIRRGFYSVLPPEYISIGTIPPSLFMGDMMDALGRRYYVGLFSAAAIHGAGHQQPMEYFVVTEYPPLRAISNDKLKVNFQVKKSWSKEDTVSIKTDVGYLQVSTPELTSLDLMYYSGFGMSQVLTVIQELAEAMKPGSLRACAGRFPQVAAIQRLGYILENELGMERLSEALHKTLLNRKSFPIPLDKTGMKKGEMNSKWKVFVNKNIEVDP